MPVPVLTKKTGSSVFKDMKKSDITRLRTEEFAELLEKFTNELELDDEAIRDLGLFYIRAAMCSHLGKTLETVYTLNFVFRYILDPCFTLEDVRDELTSRHTATQALVQSCMIYDIAKSDFIRDRLEEVIIAIKMYAASRETKA